MDEASRAKWHREAELNALPSVQLGEMLAERGYAIDARQNKANRRAALLHLEGYGVAEQIVKSLKLRRITDERTPEAV